MDTSCTCGLLPCICTEDNNNLELFVEIAGSDTVQQSDTSVLGGKPSKLRQLIGSSSAKECVDCMFLPCICPPEGTIEEEVDEVRREEGTAASGKDAQVNDTEADAQQVISLEEESDEEMDEYGRVLLPQSKSLAERDEDDESAFQELWVAKELKRFLKPHQVVGAHFLYQNVQNDQGCILADYMGLGKTLQVITVTYSYLVDKQQEEEAAKTPPTAMILCPAICIPNWQSEFQKWLSPHSRQRCPVFAFDAAASKGSVDSRMKLLQSWKSTGGILLMGYEMFRGLLNPTSSSSTSDPAIQVCTRVSTSTMEVTSAVSRRLEKSAKDFTQLLCSPGADLVVLDEGHRMKDPTSLLCQSVMKVKSPRRLVLTGYPVQNSLSEYWCMVDFARKGFLGSYESFRSNYEKPIVEGDKAKSSELIEKLQSVVLRRGPSLLRTQLPPKKEWILYCKLSPLQHQLYCDYLHSSDNPTANDGGKPTTDLLSTYATLMQVMNHPDIIHCKFNPSNDGDLAAIEASETPQQSVVSDGWEWESTDRTAQRRRQAQETVRKRKQKRLDQQKAQEWARPALFGSTENSDGNAGNGTYHQRLLEHSGKMAILMRIVDESFACGDKVVVFSQSVPTLQIIRDFLEQSEFNPKPKPVVKTREVSEPAYKKRKGMKPKRDPAGILRKRRNKVTKAAGNKGMNSLEPNEADDADAWFLQIDGGTNGQKRMEYIKRFSSQTSPVKLLLVSTRAGAEGINLHAANRLVLFDVSWNPSNDHQAMCRSHRIGQTKTVHVYRLVSTGTMERMIYEQQMKKVDLSTSVVDRDAHSEVEKKKNVSSSTCTSPDSGSEEAETPVRGFFELPPAQDLTTGMSKQDVDVGEDQVLLNCLEKMGHWLEDVLPVNPTEDGSSNVLAA